MDITLFDSPTIRHNLLPFTFTRPVAQVRVGILKISEKWETFGFSVGYETQDYLQEKFPNNQSDLKINGALCPNDNLVEAIKSLKPGQRLTGQEEDLAINGSGEESISFEGDFRLITQPWEIFGFNKEEIIADFYKITSGRKSAEITDVHTIVYGKENLFVEEGATIKAAVINAEDGPVYIGKNAQVHEGAIIKGTFALCESSHINMGAKIKGDTTVGPHSKVGGEVSNSVIFGFSNKGHDGFLGNSVIGEWCNLGADTNTSNLKNNYAAVKLWSYSTNRFANTGLQFCGLMMGDHAKCGINTMFNTGTVVGVGSNIFGSGYPRNFVPSYAWGGANGFTTFQLRKFYEVAAAVMKRRGIELDDIEKNILSTIFDASSVNRVWENKG
ncbi:GlmU family protein [Roseivirga misakiensis]|uniref:Glucose-1-phosphate thymidylyltransferase n=1 Tax=Roseivirga misakiensis TaxID=1563681 RepID=A0A1E5T5K1_9BACT|nr:GlmU family protein [Roseivirga misakiensis]OEK06640.1 glucose-1-phosphate thymidylyltransferase [Roseivirga misakiensis]